MQPFEPTLNASLVDFGQSERSVSTTTASLVADFDLDRTLVERELEDVLSGPERGNPVREAMRYAVFSGGQRIRPLLSVRVARLLGAPLREACQAAASVELFHCASLIIDDLPCMDDEQIRRGIECTHVRFGESTAILAAFGLVSLAARNVANFPRFQKKLLASLDCNALIGGQALEITDLKTVPLFELAVQAGGVSSPRFSTLEHTLMRFAREFGLAFQLVDDVLDGDLDDIATAYDQLESARKIANMFGERGSELTDLIDYLHDRLN